MTRARSPASRGIPAAAAAGDRVLRGTRAIREARLECFDNRSPGRDYTVQFAIPEFTCLCPQSGFPDFATIHIRYVPGALCLELRSLKLWINGFRDRHVYHEDVTTGILDELVHLLAPRYCEVVGDFNVRGNIKTVVRARHRAEGWRGEPDDWWQPQAAAAAVSGRAGAAGASGGTGSPG